MASLSCSKDPATAGAQGGQRLFFPAPQIGMFGRTVAFLALGSLGDCLPLCVLAATLPAHFRRSQHTHGLQLGRGLAERRHASSRGDLRSDGETGGLQRQKRRADPDGNRTSADRIGSRCTVTATVVTHRSNCGLLKGARVPKRGSATHRCHRAIVSDGTDDAKHEDTTVPFGISRRQPMVGRRVFGS